MRYILLGVLIGLLLGFIPLMEPSGAMEFYPEWYGRIGDLQGVEKSTHPALLKSGLPPLQKDNTIWYLNADGTLVQTIAFTGKNMAASGNGRYFVEYEKVGKSIEFLNREGERFWKSKSLEYPYLSQNGRIVLLLTGDHSRVRIMDNNGAETGAREISGRLCTVLAFSRISDASAVGFLDGSYYLLDGRGNIAASGTAPNGSIIKSLAVSNNGRYLALHYGNRSGDHLGLLDSEKKSLDTLELGSRHYTKTALHVSNSGHIAFLDHRRILITDDDCDIDFEIKIPDKRQGHAGLDLSDGLYAASFSLTTGGTQFLLFRDNGHILLSRSIPEESFLDCWIKKPVILLRGSQGLYCYSFHDPANP